MKEQNREKSDATDTLNFLAKAKELTLSRVPTDQEDGTPTQEEIDEYLRDHPDEIGDFRMFAIVPANHKM